MPANVATDVNRPNLPEMGGTLTAEIDVEPGEQADPVSRHVSLVIDTSGSMNGEKLERARDGASWIFGLLEPEDYVSIVSFDSEAELIMRPVQWAETSREAAMSHVNELTAGGGTDMYDGLERAKEALETLGYSVETDNVVRRVLLLSDGKDQDHEPADFETLAEEIDEAGIRIQSGGIGTDYNEETIRTLGTTARGQWTHLEQPGDIEAFFGEAVEAASEVVAPDAQVELDAAEGVEISEMYRALPQAQDADPDWANNTATVKLPDLVERERQRVVCKVHAPERELDAGEERTETLVDVRLQTRTDDASGEITVTYTDDGSKLAENNEEVAMDHRQTVIKTELGKGNVEAAETQVEKMTKIHGEDTAVVEEAQRETQLVKEGGRKERNQATKIVDDDGLK